MGLRKLWVSIAIAVLATLPALYFRYTGSRPDPIFDSAIFGIAILASGFMLSWGAESAEGQISSGLILAIVALVTVLPEYAIDIYYAWRAGQAPQSNYVHYAAANMTGANRLLVGLAWPLLVLINWRRNRERGICLAPVNGVEIAFLLVPTIYAFAILLRNRIGPFDAIVLIGIFAAYVWRVTTLPKAREEDEDEEQTKPGLAAVIESLPVKSQWLLMAALAIVAAVVIFLSAEPFAESMVHAGRAIGVNEFLLIQWLAPLASEAPAVTVAILFVLSARPAAGMTTMISDKINQWTLLVGMLPLAMSVGAGALTSLPLDARQHEEFFLTAAQSLFGIALLLRLRLGLAGAGALAILFIGQVAVAFILRDDEARTITTLTWLGWGYIAFAVAIAAANLDRLTALWRGLFGTIGSPVAVASTGPAADAGSERVLKENQR